MVLSTAASRWPNTLNSEAIKADYQQRSADAEHHEARGKPSRSRSRVNVGGGWVLPQGKCRGGRRQVILPRVAVWRRRLRGWRGGPGPFLRVRARNKEESMLRFEINDRQGAGGAVTKRTGSRRAAHHENQQIEPIHLLADWCTQAGWVVPSHAHTLGARSETLSQEIDDPPPPGLPAAKSAGFRKAAHGVSLLMP